MMKVNMLPRDLKSCNEMLSRITLPSWRHKVKSIRLEMLSWTFVKTRHRCATKSWITGVMTTKA